MVAQTYPQHKCRSWELSWTTLDFHRLFPSIHSVQRAAGWFVASSGLSMGPLPCSLSHALLLVHRFRLHSGLPGIRLG